MTPHGAQAAGRRRAQSQRQLGGQILIGDSAHPVGAEQSSHADKLLIDGGQRANCQATNPSQHPYCRGTGTKTRPRDDSPPALGWMRAVRSAFSETYLAVVGAAVELDGVVSGLSTGAFSD